jgi:hypothetical protein
MHLPNKHGTTTMVKAHGILDKWKDNYEDGKYVWCMRELENVFKIWKRWENICWNITSKNSWKVYEPKLCIIVGLCRIWVHHMVGCGCVLQKQTRGKNYNSLQVYGLN